MRMASLCSWFAYGSCLELVLVCLQRLFLCSAWACVHFTDTSLGAEEDVVTL